MDKSKYKQITLSKREAKEQEKIIEMLKTIEGTIVKKNFLTGTLRLYVPKPKPNPKLSGKGFFIETPYEISGIIHK